MHAKLQLSIRCSFLFLRQSACFAQRFGDDPLLLAVGGAELVSSPCLNGTHRFRIDAQYKTFCSCLFFSHAVNDSMYPYSPQAGRYRRHRALRAGC